MPLDPTVYGDHFSSQSGQARALAYQNGQSCARPQDQRTTCVSANPRKKQRQKDFIRKDEIWALSAPKIGLQAT